MPYFILITILIKYVFVRIDYFNDFHVGRAALELIPFFIILGVMLLFPFPIRMRNGIWLIINFVVSCTLFASSVYFHYYGELASHYSFAYLNQVGHVKDSVFDVLNLTYFLFFFDFPLLLLLHFLKRPFPFKGFYIRYSTWASVALICGLVFTWQVWSQVRHSDETSIQKGYARGVNSYLASEIVLAILPEKQSATGAVSTTEIQKLKGWEAIVNPVGYGVAKNKNVLILQLEAFQNMLLHQSIDGQEITPHLNKLIEESTYFPNFYQQIGRGNTSDAEFMSVTGLLPNSDMAVSTKFGDRAIPSLVRILNDKGYRTSTFHADKITFWSRDKLYPALGWSEHYAIDYFDNQDVVGLGPSDHILYKKTVEKLLEYKQADEPFLSEIVSLTAHGPFKLPEHLQTLQLPKSYEGTSVGNYMQAQHYADEQVGYLIDLLKQNHLYEDTVLVIYGDHFGLHPTVIPPTEIKLIEQLIDRPYLHYEAYKVPLIMHVPGLPASRLAHVGGQTDIMPTIANLLGVSLANTPVIGQDLLNYADNVLVEPSYVPLGSFVTDDYFFFADAKTGFTDGKAYAIENGEEMSKTEEMKKTYDRALAMKKWNDRYMEGLKKIK